MNFPPGFRASNINLRSSSFFLWQYVLLHPFILLYRSNLSFLEIPFKIENRRLK